VSILDKLPYLITFARFVLRHIKEDNCARAASALAYSTLLSSVPLMTIIFNMLSAFPAFQGLDQQIQDFVFSNFVPAAGEVVQDYLKNFSQKTSQLTILGIIFLIITALMMLRTIDQSINTIWHNHESRSTVQSLLVYWAILSLGPLLIGLSIFMTSYVFSLPFFSGVTASNWQFLWLGLPFLSAAIAFTLLYMVIPKQRVPLRFAFIGGVLAALLFEIAKKLFALYVTHADAYTTIYGALASIPLFLIWVYVSWFIILLGAELTYCLMVFPWHKECATEQIHDDNAFLRAFRILGHLWQAQCKGLNLSLEGLMQAENWRNQQAVTEVLQNLEKAHWIQKTAQGNWSLARDLDELRVVDCYYLMSGGLSSLPIKDDSWNQFLKPLLVKMNHQTEDVLGLSLKQCYQHPAETV